MNPQKLFLIIKREYLTRIRSKVFIISTLLAPLLLLAIIFVPVLLTKFQTSQTYDFAILDQTGQVAHRLVEMNPERYTVIESTSVDSLKKMVLQGSITGYITIDQGVLDGTRSAQLVYSGSGGISLISEIRGNLRSAVRNALLEKMDVSTDVRKIINRNVDLQTSKLTESGTQKQDTTILFIIGYVMAFMIYTAMFTYGGIIMRGVLEEKTSRIIEIMASSARPIELLTGKVMGVGAVGVTQFLIWATIVGSLSMFAGPIAARFAGAGAGQAAAAGAGFHMPAIPPSLWIYFVVFFMLGYLMYGALFAAVGSAADSETDIQQLMFPIIIPIIIPILLLGGVASNPDSTMAVVTSLIPLFSPILMIARLAITDVPLWQSLGSIVLMLLTFLGFMWLSSRIYRVGILMYGKKPSFRELARWLRYR